MLLICDDCSFNRNFCNGKGLRYAFMNGRLVTFIYHIYFYLFSSIRNAWMDIIVISQVCHILFSFWLQLTFFFFYKQWMLAFRPEMRCQADYIWVLADNNWADIKKLHEHWFGCVSSFRLFRDIFRSLTSNWGGQYTFFFFKFFEFFTLQFFFPRQIALVLDNNANTTNLESCLFWYRANYGHSTF
jgi:hypothetical protein